MASLSNGPRINARTTPRIHGSVKRSGLLATASGLKFQGRDVTSESVTSAVLYAFLELSDQQQLEFLRKTIPKLEAELQSLPD